MKKRKRGKPRLRITGVVKAMNRARDSLSAGIPASEAEDFRGFIRNTVSAVETICRGQRLKPEQLPAPTFRAYQYLKSLDLSDLPIQDGSSRTPAKSRVRVSNLVSFCRAIQVELSRLAEESTKKSRRPFSENNRLTGILQRIQATRSQAAQILRDQGSSPEALPLPSFRAFQWLDYLSDRNQLEAHLACLGMAVQVIRQGDCQKKLPSTRRDLPIHFELYNIPYLYRTRIEKNVIRIVANEGFIFAPSPVLRALVCSALDGSKSRFLSQARDYAETEDFIEVLLALEINRTGSPTDTRGQYYDLEQIYNRVNADYFDGEIEKPKLTWNKTLTHRKFGHYQPSSDTIMVSITLDSDAIPEYVLDFVMYHELLHKKLGVLKVNGRRYAHNHQFRAEEQKFHRYAEAQEILKQTGQKILL